MAASSAALGLQQHHIHRQRPFDRNTHTALRFLKPHATWCVRGCDASHSCSLPRSSRLSCQALWNSSENRNDGPRKQNRRNSSKKQGDKLASLANLGVTLAAVPAFLMAAGGGGGPTGPSDKGDGGGDGGSSGRNHLWDIAADPDDEEYE